MAKEKRSVADLDAELAALEAEIAALEGKGKTKAAPKPSIQPPAAAPDAPPAPEKKSRFGLPKRKAAITPEPAPPEKKARFGFGRKAQPEAQAPAPVEEPVLDDAPVPAPATYDAAAWRHEDGAWVRSMPREVPVVRRVLDEEERVVREEPATRMDLEQDDTVKAERGARRLFGRKR